LSITHVHALKNLLGAGLSLIVALAATDSCAEGSSLTPGLYEVEIRLSLPNVDSAAVLSTFTRCITPADLRSGWAFFVLSDNPLKGCELLDYQAKAETAFYRIACPGPNRGSAVAVFDTTRTSFRGTIKMNMGGKNMTMSEVQVGKRIAACP
jgi:hypothetical protein